MLEAVGVAPHDEAVYRLLLSSSQVTAAELAARGGWSDDSVCSSVARLEDLGLLTRTADSPARLVPMRPDVAVDVLVTRRRAEMEQAQLAARDLLGELQVQDQHRPESLLEVVVGQESIATRFSQLLSQSDTELLVLDRPPYASPSRESDRSVRDLLARGVEVRGIYAPESLNLPGSVDEAYSAARAGERSRVHPQIPMKLAVFDRTAALLPLSVDRLVDSAIVVHRCSLLDALVEMFDLLWEQAVPVTYSDQEEVDARLLTLLSSGLKDDAVARQLNVSSRTVGRRISALMDGLGARTRFQAGMYVERSGLAPGE